MFRSDELESHLATSHSIKNVQSIWAEWNLNQSYNISKVGNYRYRPASGDPKYSTIRGSYEVDDLGGYYTGATDSDIIVNAGFNDIDEPVYHVAPKRKINLLYSLEDCLKPHRPRSGINKMLYLGISGQGAGRSQYLDSLTSFRQVEDYPITGVSYATISGETYVTYTSTHRLQVGDYVKTTDIQVDGSARVTISSGATTGSYDNINYDSIYIGQQVLGSNFADGTVITDISSTGNSISFSNPAISSIDGVVLYFTGTGTSEFNLSTAKIVESITPTSFTVKSSITRPITYAGGGVATMGYAGVANIARRPRYYMASRYDDFKYWTSYRTEVESSKTNEYGISIAANTGGSNPSYYIYDAAPFVVYNKAVPANRIVIKMQTNVGDINYGPYRINNNINMPDPLYGEENMTTPKRWAVQVLNDDNEWVFVKSFSENDSRTDGTPVIGSDGYVELEYGLVIPDENIWGDFFTLVETISDSSLLPDGAPYGDGYLLKISEHDKGILFISDGAAWQNYVPTYAWQLVDKAPNKNTKLVTSLVNPDYYTEDGLDVYREVQFINGIRIVVDTMNKVNSTFDLIEMSPRLVAEVSNKVTEFSIKKVLSDLANHSMPTGNLLASTGTITLFDEDLAFNENNTFDPQTNLGSLIADYTDSKVKFTFYEIIRDVGGLDYYIPIKHLYSDKTPQVSDVASIVSFDLRDTFFLLESKKAPEMLLTNVSVSYAITVLLDNIGFSNYTFKRVSNEEELIIPYFFISTDQNVAEVLEQLAVSAQCAIFFDEFNNLVVMSKGYLVPSDEDRPTDIVLYGQEEVVDGQTVLPNIVNIASQEKKVFNDGNINYTTRYIQRSIGSISQAPYTQEYKTYVYKPVLLWEVAGQEQVRTINESAQQSQGYSLAAAPLKTTLTASVPSWDTAKETLKDNIMDFGESVYWLGNHSGYFYSSGEIIKYDAVEYSVAGVGNVWITNNQEYQNYFSRLRFNGKMYPTGRVRIYAKLNGTEVVEHGRGQFGTVVIEHQAGIDQSSPWVNNSNVRGFLQSSKDYLFNTNPVITYPTTGEDAAGNSLVTGGQIVPAQPYALKSTRNGIIKNLSANSYITENETNYYKTALTGSVQTSALVFNGPSVPSDVNAADYITYAYKPMVDSDGQPQPFTHFGTRMRIIGKIESTSINDQTPEGAVRIYSSSELVSNDPTKQVSIEGGSGGIAFNLNAEKNIGYYYEIVALTQNNLSSFKNNSNEAIYYVATSPVTQVVNDVATVTLTTQHDFEIGNKVSLSGLIDDNRKSSLTAMNGEYEITAISQDRKQFQYTVTPPTNTTASITSVAKTGTGPYTITYTTSADHGFRVGQLVTVTLLAPAAYNVTSATITAVPSTTSFSVSVTTDPGTLSDQIGTATYVPLSTTSASGGTVTKSADTETQISDVFFYKVVSGYNEADILKKAKTTTTATLTTLREHSFSVGEQVTVAIGDATDFDGTWTITAVTAKTFTYTHTASATVAETELSVIGKATSTTVSAIPVILWRGLTEILVDDGSFTSQQRLTSNEKSTVYDLSAEYLNIGSARQFYLYLNNKQIATVTDLEPIKEYNNIALFVRGSSRVMFENVYALADNFGENQARSLQLPISKVFSDDLISESEAINKYAISGIVQNTYLTGISSETTPRYSIYYEEFGTIMREAAFFKVKYDKAFPALYSKLAKTINRVRGYTTSGYFAGSYGAEFLIFNAVDKNLNLDDTTGNYLRILGIAFTQNTTHSLTVDDYFKKNSNFVNALYSGGTVDAGEYLELYNDIENSRNKYGKNSFVIDAAFVQTDAAADSMMDWIIRRTMKPKKAVGVATFAVPHVQLGDIATINYVSNDGVDVVSGSDTRYVVYAIEYNKASEGSSNYNVYLAEV
jgi:hypothetical protein